MFNHKEFVLSVLAEAGSSNPRRFLPARRDPKPPATPLPPSAGVVIIATGTTNVYVATPSPKRR